MLSVLGSSYDLEGGDHLHLNFAKKLIEIMRMISVCTSYPKFFSKAGPIKVLRSVSGRTRLDPSISPSVITKLWLREGLTQ
jgi:hypothetical protein